MTDTPTRRSARTPDSFVALRIVAAVLMLFATTLLGLGLAGMGPLGDLITVTDQVRVWIYDTTGLRFS